MRRRLAFALSALTLVSAACGGDDDVQREDDAAGVASADDAFTPIDGEHATALDHVITAGAPSADRVRALGAEGVHVLSFQAESEEKFDEQAAVEGAGGTFTRVALSPNALKDPAVRARAYDVLDAAEANGANVFAHCASGNRAGALLALYLAERKGKDPKAALEAGKAAGLTKLEDLVSEVLHGGEHAYRPDGMKGHHGSGEHHGGGHGHHRFDDAEKWAERFESAERDAWQKPDAVIAGLGLDEDDVVADIGAATGYFPVRIAKVVPEGRVIGVDIEPSMVDYLNARAEREGLKNLTAQLGAPDDAKLVGPIDVIIVVNTYHHIADRPAYFKKLHRALAEGGRVVIVDFKKEASPIGPPPEMRLAPETVTAEMGDAGFVVVASDDDTLPYQYVRQYAVQK